MDLSGFSRFGEVTVYEKTTEEECPERVREADIVICNKVRMCSRTLSGAENLKLICVTATGINNIDLDYVKRHNIAVTNVAGYSTVSVAQPDAALNLTCSSPARRALATTVVMRFWSPSAVATLMPPGRVMPPVSTSQR